MDAKIFDDLISNRYMSIVGFTDSIKLDFATNNYSDSRAFITKLNLDDFF
jgi:hypothetical protein